MDIGSITVHLTPEEDDWRPAPPFAASPVPPAQAEQWRWAVLASVAILLGGAGAVWRFARNARRLG